MSVLKLITEVSEIRGQCPVYKKDDKWLWATNVFMYVYV